MLCWYERLLERALTGERFLLVRAFIRESVHISNSIIFSGGVYYKDLY